mgnify:CR=1 FL=1
MTKGLPKSNLDMMDRLNEAEDEHGKRLDDEEIICWRRLPEWLRRRRSTTLKDPR